MKKLRIAIQKKGRLNKESLALLKKCGIEVESKSEKLILPCKNSNIELLFVRDDDIPLYLDTGVCDLAIVGLNEIVEKGYNSEIIRNLGFAKCRLSLAKKAGSNPNLFESTIASSYPNILTNYLNSIDIKANIVEITGCVEIAPKLGISDYICDLVSTGATLKANDLEEVQTIFESEAVLARSSKIIDPFIQEKINQLLERIDAVIKAKNTKYIMMNAPKTSIESISNLISPMEDLTVVALLNNDNRVAIHAAITAENLWEKIELLKGMGASSILVSEIDKAIA